MLWAKIAYNSDTLHHVFKINSIRISSTRCPIRQHTFEHGRDLGEGCDWSERGKLPESEFEEEQRQPGDGQHDDVRDQEGGWNSKHLGIVDLNGPEIVLLFYSE